MEFYALYPLTLPLLVHDALIAVGAAIVLIGFLVFIHLGVLLPGLLTSLGGPQPNQRGAYLEFGPASAPIISEPVSRGAALPERTRDLPTVVRPHLWRLVSGGGTTPLTSPTDGVAR